MTTEIRKVLISKQHHSDIVNTTTISLHSTTVLVMKEILNCKNISLYSMRWLM